MIPDFFKEIAEEEGWTQEKMLSLACEYISETDNEEKFQEFLRYSQEQEKDQCPKCFGKMVYVTNTLAVLNDDPDADDTNMIEAKQCPDCGHWVEE